MKTIKIEVLYPEFNNLYGDRGNLLYLTQKLAACDVKIQVIVTHLHDVPAFTQQDDIHVLLIGPCTERQQELELEQLIPIKNPFKSGLKAEPSPSLQEMPSSYLGNISSGKTEKKLQQLDSFLTMPNALKNSAITSCVSAL